MTLRHSFALVLLLVSPAVFGCGGKSVAEETVKKDAGKDAAAGTGGSAGNDASTGGGGAGGNDASTGGGGVGGNDAAAGSAGSSGQAGTAGTGGSQCSLATGSSDCDGCMNASCYDQCNACASGTECAAFVTCALGCTSGDAACMQGCMTDHEAGVQDGLPLVGPDGCLRNSCNAECIVQGQTCTFSIGDGACDDCVAGYCMDECTTCAGNDTCVALVQCEQSCDPGDQGCLVACSISNPGGIGDATGFYGTGSCVSKNCSVECEGAPADCAYKLGEADCDACITQQCLTACNTCAANDACVALVDCGKTCAPDDQACLGACAMANPTGIPDANGFMGTGGCVQQKCSTACGTTTAACTIETGNVGCDACIQTQCGGSCSACSEQPECVALVECTLGCDPSDIACQVQCSVDHSGGITTAGPLIGPGACVASECSYWCQ